MSGTTRTYKKAFCTIQPQNLKNRLAWKGRMSSDFAKSTNDSSCGKLAMVGFLIKARPGQAGFAFFPDRAAKNISGSRIEYLAVC
jgi:hypothetical protein